MDSGLPQKINMGIKVKKFSEHIGKKKSINSKHYMIIQLTTYNMQGPGEHFPFLHET